MAAGIVAVAAVLAGCGTDREITRPDPVPVDEELVTRALLTADDLPGAFTESDDPAPVATDVLPEHDCDDALSELEAEATAAAEFTGGGVTLNHTVSHFPGNGGAVEQLLRNLASDGCKAVVVADQGLNIRALPLDFGVLTDDTFAFRFEIEPNTGPIEERDVILRRSGDLVSIIRVVGPRPSDKALLDAAVRTSIGRLGLIALEASGR